MNPRTRLIQLKMLLWRQSSYSQTGEDQIITHLASAHKRLKKK